MKYSELEKKLSKAGCYKIVNGSHPWWFSPLTGQRFKTSNHGSEEVKIGTLKSISKMSGVKF
jgi:mRNA interferase HicA